MIGSARLKPAYTATTVCFAGERPVVIDGSFATEPDAMGAIALISVDNLDQALRARARGRSEDMSRYDRSRPQEEGSSRMYEPGRATER